MHVSRTGAAVKGGRTSKFRFLIVVVCFVGALAAPGLAAAGPTIVSLTFDDNTSDEYAARSILAQHSMHGTFYVNSDNVGLSSAFLNWTQLSDLAADGNEIGGHTLDHIDLLSVDSTEATRQVCADRQAIISHGFTVTDFAYPYGDYDTNVESIVRGCGYSAARRSWGLCPIADSLAQCASEMWVPDPVETIPPQDIMATRTIESVRAWHTLDQLEGVVTRAEAAGGGWVTLVMHHVCDGCDPTNGYSISPALLSAFLDWLAPRSSSGTRVRTVRDVVSDKTAPSSSIMCNGTSCSSWYNQAVSVSLSATDAGTGVAAIRYTTDGSDPTSSSTLYTGAFTVSTTSTVKYRAWDAAGNAESTKSQLIQFDFTPPVSAIACNNAACSSNTYTAPVNVSLSATDSGGSGGTEIHYETNGSDPTIFSPLYIAPFTVSTTTTVKYRAWDKAGNAEATKSQLIQVNTNTVDTTPPTSTIACNGAACSSAWYGPPVSVALSATDPDDSVAAIRYTTDGSVPTTSSALYAGPFNISTTTTVKYRAWDSAGNVEATKSQVIQVDTFAPTVTITSPASGAAVKGTVKITAAATDSQTGVASVTFSVDGSALGTATASPWQIPWNTKKFSVGQHVLTAVAKDRGGNSTTSPPVTVTVR
jgi:peptidoglycan/xylan/chitin deacetylase (PgdA/CDA1 family)